MNISILESPLDISVSFWYFKGQQSKNCCMRKRFYKVVATLSRTNHSWEAGDSVIIISPMFFNIQRNILDIQSL
jgi:hypothetical protein